MKRFLISTLKLTGLLFLIFAAAAMAPKIGLLTSTVVLLAGGIAVIKPLPSVGLGHRGFSLLILTLVGPLGLIASAALMYEADNQTNIETMIDRARDEAQQGPTSQTVPGSADQTAAEKALQIEREARAAVQAEKKRLAEKHCKGDWNGIDALVVSQLQYIKPKLRSPSTADFPVFTDDDVSVTNLNDCVFVVRTYVDAQNAFGATIRTHFVVKVQRDINNPDAWRLIDMFTLD